MSPSSAEVAGWPQSLPTLPNTDFDPKCITMSPAAIASTAPPAVALKENVVKECPIGKALIERVAGIDVDECDAGHEDAFFVGDMGEVYRQFVRWKKHLPRVEPFYAVKCNTDKKVLQLLAALGTGFDCASKQEIGEILGMGVDPSRIVYAHPCKTASYLRYAASQNVRLMTFDNAEELHKIKRNFPNAQLLLRISTDDSKALCQFSLKYGAHAENIPELLATAARLDLDLVGVSFHVGSGSYDPPAFGKAVEDARVVFDMAKEYGYDMNLLDVGGGYQFDNFEDIAAVLGPTIDKLFEPEIRVIAEPGRYFVSSAFTIAAHIIARRTVETRGTGDKSYMLYLNDGVYGNFSGVMFDHQHPIPKLLKSGNTYHYESTVRGDNTRLTRYSIWGPTCDGIDFITKKCYLPDGINTGDWLYFSDMGAYNKCSATKFNGFRDDHSVIYVTSEPEVLKYIDLD